MIIINKNINDIIPNFKESDIKDSIILCLSTFPFNTRTLSIIEQTEYDTIIMKGIHLNHDIIDKEPRQWDAYYNNKGARTLLELMIYKQLDAYKHVYYIIKTMAELSNFITEHNLQDSKFLEYVISKNILRS